jgi:hypothetical protein
MNGGLMMSVLVPNETLISLGDIAELLNGFREDSLVVR